MIFIHKASDFADLIDTAADEAGVGVAIVEKDYWVVHTLWTLLDAGFDIWFKGGTSLSKGFRIIERFSEDLDLKLEPGSVSELKPIPRWKSAKPEKRRKYCEQLSDLISVDGADVHLDHDAQSPNWTSPNIQIQYPCIHRGALIDAMSPFVKLELGDARVIPFVYCDLSAFIHDRLRTLGIASEYIDNRPMGVRCLHPRVTLIEKLCALSSRFAAHEEPGSYVRHFEDAAKIIQRLDELPPLNEYANTKALVDDMVDKDRIARPSSADRVFMPGTSSQWNDVQTAWERIEGMYWGPRTTLEDACKSIRAWIVHEIE